jgi:hypothetical protein
MRIKRLFEMSRLKEGDKVVLVRADSEPEHFTVTITWNAASSVPPVGVSDSTGITRILSINSGEQFFLMEEEEEAA